ncbi:MAG: NAD(P)H-hydrate dehydratase [Planctomycetota bacterium]|nr:NAD(P)H-hydrate dehydratase [Planctomycetota bacterium]
MPDTVEHVTLLPKLARRRRDAHKGDFGRVLVVGGSRGMVGAVALAANAALRGGAGLVTFAAPQTVQQTIAAICPCATSVALACDKHGELAAGAVRQMVAAAKRSDVLAVGPGLDVGLHQKNLIRAALALEMPIVIDADGLNNLAAIDGWPAMQAGPTVLTPHPGEFARLSGKSTAEIQSNRQQAAAGAVQNWAAAPPLVCVLKGAGSVVTDGRRLFVNATGNPGMATGGSGDVLTGLTAALIAQGLGPFEAACLAVHVHGRAGDMAADKLGEVSLTASDLLEFLPAAMKECIGCA